MGLEEGDFEAPSVALWSEHYPVLLFFRKYITQWRQGPSGPSGLDYNVIFHEMDRMGLKEDDYDELLESLQVMEAEALRQIHKD